MNTLIGKTAPDFCTKAVINGQIIDNFTLSHHRDKYVILLFYPLDFTFVCPTELYAFQEVLPQFQGRNALIIGCSIDSCYTHQAWLATPRSKGGIEGVQFPLVSDINKSIAKDYGVLHPSEGVAYRGLFLIDRQGIVRHQLINDLFLGRSTTEALRVLDALQAFEQHGEVCPANWEPGKLMLSPNKGDLEKYMSTCLN